MTKHQKQEIVFFIDRCLGKKTVVEALRNAGAIVKIHDDCFPQDTPDEEWLLEVGKKNWVVLTKDEKIGSRLHEQIAVAQGNVKLFILASTNLSGQQIAETFVKTLGKMEKFSLNHPAPFMAKVYHSGQISLWQSDKKLLKQLNLISQYPTIP
jgi:predicted nuclease of predicted toxin-antitoxin system